MATLGFSTARQPTCTFTEYKADGFLCYGNQNLIRILNVFRADKTEIVVDIAALLAEEAIDPKSLVGVTNGPYDINVLAYKDGLITVKLLGSQSALLVVDIANENTALRKRRNRIHYCWKGNRGASHRLMTMMTNEYVFLICSPDHHGWTLHGKDLHQASTHPSRKRSRLPLQINLFSFLVYDGWFLIVCPRPPWQMIEDRTGLSYLYCLWFPIKNLFTQPACTIGIPLGTQAVKFLRYDGAHRYSPVHLIQDEQTGSVNAVAEGLHQQVVPQPLIFPEYTPETSHDTLPIFKTVDAGEGFFNIEKLEDWTHRLNLWTSDWGTDRSRFSSICWTDSSNDSEDTTIGTSYIDKDDFNF